MKIRKEKIIYYICFILIINTSLYRVTIFQYIRAACLGLMVVRFLLVAVRNKVNIVNGISGMIFLFLVVEGLSTIVNRQSFVSFMGSGLVVMLGVLLLKTCKYEEFKTFLMAISEISLILLGINIFSILLFPQGFSLVSNEWGWKTGVYFLGQNMNYFLLLVVPFFASFLLYYLFSRKDYIRVTAVILIIYAFANLFVFEKREMTSFLVCTMLLASYFLVNRKSNRKKLPIVLTIAIIVIVFVGFIFSGSLLSNPIVVYLFNNILHKSTNLTGRTYIWENAWLKIIKRPFLGYGVGAQVVTYIQGVFVSAHNQILHILIEGGVSALFVFLIIMVKFVFLLYKIRDNRISNLLLISFIAFSGSFLTVAFGLATSWELYFVFMLAEYVNIYEKSESNNGRFEMEKKNI